MSSDNIRSEEQFKVAKLLPDAITFANEHQASILSKRLAPQVSMQSIPVKTAQSGQPPLQEADIILIDDSQVFADSIIFRLAHRKVVHYPDPRIFLEEYESYAKDTPICIDHHFGVEIPLSGVEVAEQLHALGFTRLFIVSGAYFEPEELPGYITLIKKMDLDVLDSL